MHFDRKLQKECQKSANVEMLQHANAAILTGDELRNGNILSRHGTEGPGIGEVSVVSPQAIALQTKLHLPSEQCKDPATPLHISPWKEAPRLPNHVSAQSAEGLTTKSSKSEQNMAIVDDSISR